MPWEVPPVGGSYRGGAPKCTTPGPIFWSLSQKPSFLLSCPAAEGARASVRLQGSSSKSIFPQARLRCRVVPAGVLRRSAQALARMCTTAGSQWTW